MSSPSIQDSPDPDNSIISPAAEHKQHPKAYRTGLRRKRASDVSNFDKHFATLMENVTETTQALVNENKGEARCYSLLVGEFK